MQPVIAEIPSYTEYKTTRATYKTTQLVQQTLANLHEELQFDTLNVAEFEKRAAGKLAVRDLAGFEAVIRDRESHNENELLHVSCQTMYSPSYVAKYSFPGFFITTVMTDGSTTTVPLNYSLFHT